MKTKNLLFVFVLFAILIGFSTNRLFAQDSNAKQSDKVNLTSNSVAESVSKTADKRIGKGIVAGKIVDAATGEPLIEANIYLKGTYLGDAADLDGNYRIINIPAGTYTLISAYAGYKTLEISDVIVKDNEITQINITMEEEIIEGEEITITAKRLVNVQAALLKQRQKADAVSDAISAEEMSNSGSSDAADVMESVPGASIVGGKYVYIRGLGERYSSTQLNGAELPSSDPNKKTVQLDLFPSSFLENIVTTKSFTPDKPGNFTGGSVNIGTKTFPEELTISVSASTSYNSNVTGNDNFLTYSGGKTDWFGKDDGTRSIPDILKDSNVEIPSIGASFTNKENALLLDKYSKAFNGEMAPAAKSAPLNQNYNMSIGNQFNLFNRPLGYLASIMYNRSFSHYENGTTARWLLSGNVNQTDDLTNDYNLSDEQSKDEVVLGGLFNLSYQVHPNHMIGLNYMYNRVGESTARYQVGTFPRDLTTKSRYETRTLHYVERQVGSYQLRGKHYFENLAGLKIDWISSYSTSLQDEPDLRFFTDDYTTVIRQGQPVTTYHISPSIYPEPTRYYRDLEENNWDSKIDFSLPYKQWNGLSGNLKFGMSYTDIDHQFRERYFQFKQNQINYDGDPYNFFNEDNVGILEDISTDNFFLFGNYVIDMSTPRNNYDGHQEISAYYLMTRLPLTRKLSFIGGLRYETTKLHVASHDEKLNEGNLDNKDYLPSANFVYNLTQNINFRGAYGKTLARPTFRELAPYPSFEFVNDYIFSGNADLKRTLSDNYDLRWEWFPRIGEIISASVFYKDLTDPIEKVIISINGQTRYQNVDRAVVYGAEFEVRKQLDWIHPKLNNFYLGGNLALIKSKVDIAPSELEIIRSFDQNASSTRELQGQSPYVLNTDLEYHNEGLGTNLGIYYNVFGKRITEVSLGGTPDVYEKPFHSLNVTASQKVWKHISLKFSVKNILDSKITMVHPFKGKEYVQREYSIGRTFKLGWNYSL